MTDETFDDAMGRWVPDWIYETDLLLTHFSGLKVMFDEPTNNSDRPYELRSKSKGDFVNGTVVASRQFLMRQGMSELDAVKSSMGLYRQAELLFRHRPAGSAGAPRRGA